MTTGSGPATEVQLRHGAYHDSVTLLQVSRSLAGLPGVQAAQVAMATPLNVDVLRGMGFDVPAEAAANDLLVAVRGADDDAVAGALAALEDLLAPRRGDRSERTDGPRPPRPRTTGAALRRGEATLALVSVPGAHAFAEAYDAVLAGRSVMVFSDNVPVEQEVRLKDEAAARDVLVMGPDCGTAVVGGVGLGFANVVRPGPVGLVAASGTGSQQLMALLDGAGVGVSHCLGVGGRDLSAQVRGRATLQALRMLDDDPSTELVLVVSKPPAPEVAAEVGRVAASLRTPVQLALLGPGQPDLTAAAERAVRTLGREWSAPRRWPTDDGAPAGAGAPAPVTAGARLLRGLFSGGTLCDEAMVVGSEGPGGIGAVRSNIPLRPEWGLPDARDLSRCDGHAMVDYGDDAMTQGRAHPMIDATLRLEAFAAAAADPRVGVVLLDVVLGHGAHPDPASEWAPVVAQARSAAAAAGRRLDVVVSLCGTAGDPQGLQGQAAALQSAGADVHLSNAAAARAAARLVTGARA